jgi:hypothetical protein
MREGGTVMGLFFLQSASYFDLKIVDIAGTGEQLMFINSDEPLKGEDKGKVDRFTVHVIGPFQIVRFSVTKDNLVVCCVCWEEIISVPIIYEDFIVGEEERINKHPCEWLAFCSGNNFDGDGAFFFLLQVCNELYGLLCGEVISY